MFLVVWHFCFCVLNSWHFHKSLLVTFRMGHAVYWCYYVWGFLCLCIGIPATFFLLPLVAEFLSFYIFSVSYHSPDWLLESSLLFPKFVVSPLATYGLSGWACESGSPGQGQVVVARLAESIDVGACLCWPSWVGKSNKGTALLSHKRASLTSATPALTFKLIKFGSSYFPGTFWAAAAALGLRASKFVSKSVHGPSRSA